MKLNKNTDDLVKKISSGKINIQEYIENLDEKKIEKILRDLSISYYNEGLSLVSDEIFDMLKEYLEKISPENPFLNEIFVISSDGRQRLLFYIITNSDPILEFLRSTIIHVSRS